MTTITRANLVGTPIASPSDTTIPRPSADACDPVNGVTPQFATAKGSVGDDGWNVDLTAHYLCDGFSEASAPYEVKRAVEGPAERYDEIVQDRNRDGFIDAQTTFEVTARDPVLGGTLSTEQLIDADFDRRAETELLTRARLSTPIPG